MLDRNRQFPAGIDLIDHRLVGAVLANNGQQNMLTNAIKYNREHGTVEVRCTASGPARLRISVKDTGVGLSAEKLTHLFEPFNRLGQEAGAEEGTGIGLVVSKQLVELMGGAIGVQSAVGVGSEFWIELTRGLGS
jgi:signal transduction histidine kinase